MQGKFVNIHSAFLAMKFPFAMQGKSTKTCLSQNLSDKFWQNHCLELSSPAVGLVLHSVYIHIHINPA